MQTIIKENKNSYNLAFPWNYIIGIPLAFAILVTVAGIFIFVAACLIAIFVAPFLCAAWLLSLIF